MSSFVCLRVIKVEDLWISILILDCDAKMLHIKYGTLNSDFMVSPFSHLHENLRGLTLLCITKYVNDSKYYKVQWIYLWLKRPKWYRLFLKVYNFLNIFFFKNWFSESSEFNYTLQNYWFSFARYTWLTYSNGLNLYDVNVHLYDVQISNHSVQDARCTVPNHWIPEYTQHNFTVLWSMSLYLKSN